VVGTDGAGGAGGCCEAMADDICVFDGFGNDRRGRTLLLRGLCYGKLSEARGGTKMPRPIIVTRAQDKEQPPRLS
jgi:hypothetical protein